MPRLLVVCSGHRVTLQSSGCLHDHDGGRGELLPDPPVWSCGCVGCVVVCALSLPQLARTGGLIACVLSMYTTLISVSCTLVYAYR